jgi:hypothetical protein
MFGEHIAHQVAEIATEELTRAAEPMPARLKAPLESASKRGKIEKFNEILSSQR